MLNLQAKLLVGVKNRARSAEIVNVLQTRCPHCSALLARGAEWCSLCLTDLRPAPIEPVREPEPALVGGSAAPGPVHADSFDGDDDGARERLMALAEISEVAHRGETADAAVDPAPARPRGRHARPSADSVSQSAHGPSLAQTLTAIRTATEVDSDAAPRRDLDAIDLSVLAGDGMPHAISQWSLKAQSPGAKVGIMAAGVAVVGGIGLLLLTIVGLVVR